ncbi:UDP-2,3-diacylglucosamine diphosphatase [Thalassomonas actiniarum]|uniref:UDP-2,3-diacylglucosamine hydrolase n=1 Tax=Thalassomonas actiniarum TaxID=485447 RepID=A0AAF0C5A0_9GAMM|nr:UDP-2,3-diacylglucosamine diphosphatase [Thalassomonas actiniarum]WDE00871.1 UDP-2,3-diacylglucosamine diphosphatase [Thalassomonas actiniarum]
MTSKANEPVTYFIADLHLAQNRPDITACFLSFLKNNAPEAEALYILGDLFESWIGDDDNSPFVIEIARALAELSQKKTKIYFIHGNRDFLLGKKYAQKSGMVLLPEVEQIELYGQKMVIMHGDTLCTRDINYQKFRKKSRSWWWQAIMKSLPLFVRRNIAENYRKKSAMATSVKSREIMDVTPQEVINCLEQYQSQLLIHGHTHRPAVHQLTANGQKAQRVVLGDWYEQGAWLKVTPAGFELLNQPFELSD